MSKNRYLIVHKDHPFDPVGVNSGAENATRSLARALVERGSAVTVAAQLSGGTIDGQVTADGVRWWDLGTSFNTLAALRRMSKEGRYRLISAGRAQPILESRDDKNCQSRILISHDRSGNDTGIRPEVLCQVADRVVCVSDAQRQVFLKAGAPAEKVVTLYNGVDLDVFMQGDPAQRDYQKMIFVGALVEDKGIHWLIEAFCALKTKYPKLTLDVYGSSALWGRKPLFNEQEIQAKIPDIRFFGKVSQIEVAQALKTSGLCVIPSIWFDPFPLTALEAQACGCPVLTFDVGGLKEGVRDQETAVVVQEISPNALTQALDQLLGNPARLRQFSERALEVCRPRFTWQRVAEDIEGVFDAAIRAVGTSPLRQGTIGIVSTWNQACGLATYARYLFSQLEAGSYRVFSEQTTPNKADEAFVVRCWQKGASDLSALERAIRAHHIALVHFNVHAEFFQSDALRNLIERLKADGIKVVAHLHNTFSLQEPLMALAQAADRLIVHGPENRLQLIANGAHPSAVSVINHGVEVQPKVSAEQRQETRGKLGIADGAVLISSFGFVQSHKGMEGVIDGVARLVQRGLDAYGVVVGEAMKADPQSERYLSDLKARAEERGIAARVSFLEKFVPEVDVVRYLQASDVVLMNYRSAHYEASGACAIAVGADALVVSSLAPPFVPFGDAVWHLTTGFPLELSLEVLLTNPTLRETLAKSRRSYCEKYSWDRIGFEVCDLYRELGVQPTSTPIISIPAERSAMSQYIDPGSFAHAAAPLKVLVQNRPNALTQAGGDTVLMNRTVEGLRAKGVEVTVDLNGVEDPSKFNLVHLFNFALPDLLKRQAERCVQAKVPFVVTTLCEDVPSFHNQSWEAARLLIEYVTRGQPRDWIAREWARVRGVSPSNRFVNDWVAEHAAALIVNGSGEAETIQRHYPNVASIISEVPVGFDAPEAATPDAFIRQYGVKDFVLCVGRIETRKNQLMLLKALEDSEIPVVLAAGGFSYQPQYEQAVRSFRRKGQTIVVDRLSPELLASAYAACRVHALPSWYELPGLVSLEAAAQGKNVVVSEVGTTPNYFHEWAFYADPSNWRSIQNAVTAAYYSPVGAGFIEHVRSYTWDRAIDRTIEVYQKVALKSLAASPINQSYPVKSSATSSLNLDQLLAAGEEAARAGKFEEARRLLEEAASSSPSSARCHRSLGAVALAERRNSEARKHFERSLGLDPQEVKSLVGLGMCCSFEGEQERAHGLYVRALRLDSRQTTALHQLIQTSNILGRFDELEAALLAYVKEVPSDIKFQFCLAGCFYKRGNSRDALTWVSTVLSSDPSHRGALDLMRQLGTSTDAPTKSNPMPSLPSDVTPKPSTVVTTTARAIPAEQSWMQSKETTPIARAAEHVSIDVGELSKAADRRSMRPSAGARVSYAPAVGSSYQERLAQVEELKKIGKVKEAASECELILQASDLDTAILEWAELLRAELFSIDGKVEEASKIFGRVLDRSPRSPRALCGRGAILAHGGNWVEAEQLFSQALAAQAEHDVACAGLGLCAAQRGKPEDAWSWYWRATKSNPECLRALLGLVELAYPLKRLQALEEALRAYLDMHPADLQFVYALAGCLYAQSRLSEAKQEVEKIIVLDSGHARALELKGMIEQGGGESSSSSLRH